MMRFVNEEVAAQSHDCLLNLSRAKSELDWRPRVPLREGLSNTIEYFRGVTAAG